MPSISSLHPPLSQVIDGMCAGMCVLARRCVCMHVLLCVANLIVKYSALLLHVKDGVLYKSFLLLNNSNVKPHQENEKLKHLFYFKQSTSTHFLSCDSTKGSSLSLWVAGCRL